jgi:TonB family protein
MHILLPLLLAAAPAAGEPSRAKGNLAALVTSDDYPAVALRAEEEGTVRFRLDVGKDGLVNACSVTESSGSASLDSATCRIMQERARFTPARNSAGKRVTDRVQSSISWRMREPSDTSSEAEAAFVAYMKCLMPHLLPAVVHLRLPLADLAVPGYAACRAEEDSLLALGRGEDKADSLLEARRADLREKVLAMVDEGRKQSRQ